MAFAQGSRTDLTYVVEPSFGATPSAPAMKSIPFTSHTLDLSKTVIEGNDLQSDRMPRVNRHGNRSVLGDIVADLRYGDFDDLIESAFFSTFASNGVLDIGTSQQFLTIEDGAADITQFRQFTGCGVSAMAVSVAPDQMVQATFNMVGKDMTQTAVTLDATPTAASGNEPFDSFSGAITEGGVAIAIISAMDFTLTNSLAPTMTVGAQTTPQLEFGRAEVAGTVTAYYQDATLINKFLNETESAIVLNLTDSASGGSHAWTFPAVRYNGAAVPVSSPQSRLVSLPFVAVYDAATTTNLRLTRS